jgi:rhamnosyltransferase
MSMGPSRERVVGVVVAYFPDRAALRELVSAARPQLKDLVIVDNTPAAAGSRRCPPIEGVEILSSQANTGLAAGLNRGCAWAREQGAEFALLFDQDSVPASDMLDRLCAAWEAAAAAGLRVAAAGPRFIDSRGARVFPFLRLGVLRNHEVVPQPSDEFVRTDTLITSGCLVSLAALDDTGAMDESLFIDNIDLDWGFRARSRGWALIGAPRAVLSHRIGDDHVAAPRWARLFGKDQAIRHGPQRLYYITRNRIRLYWRPHVPLAWKAQDLLRLPAKIVLSIWLAQNRRASAQALRRGVVDGIADRGGVMRQSPSDPAP